MVANDFVKPNIFIYVSDLVNFWVRLVMVNGDEVAFCLKLQSLLPEKLVFVWLIVE